MRRYLISVWVRWALWVVARWAPTPVLTAEQQRAQAWTVLQTVHPADDEIDAALRGAFADCGLSLGLYARDLDLLHTGKLHEVLVHASNRLGNPLVTVDDVRRLLQ